MTEKAEIKRIVLDVGGQEIELSPEQAKKLHAALDDIYGGDASEMVKYIPLSYPVIIRESNPWWQHEYPVYTSGDGVEFSYTEDNCSMNVSI